MRLLVANRGEIARRIFRTAADLGWSTAAVYATPDTDAAFVREADVATCVGGPDLQSSYLDQDAILAAAAAMSVTAIHPGYGFLSENADFARRVVEAGIVWVGPHPQAIASMGSKIDARAIAEAAGVPTIPGYADAEGQDDDRLAAEAERIGYPILVKAAAGGGGKGIRIAHSPAEFATALNDARTEASRSFGDDAVIVERYIERPRHVEVQIIGDQFGNVVELGTRDCSIQRRYQKVLEEAPAPNLAPETDAGLRDAAVRLGQAMGYDNAGTVEFVVDAETGDYFFLEVNTRLQVEHPVTEAVTGLDLVELQLSSATGQMLPITQDAVSIQGHAIEARINAEDPSNDYAPQTGRVDVLEVPHREGVRWDGAFDHRGEITPYYDSMIAKLIVSSSDRDGALAKLASVLDELVIGPLRTNTGLHRWLVDQPTVRDAAMTTRFLDEHPPPAGPAADAVAAEAGAVVRAVLDAGSSGPWNRLPAFRVTGHRPASDTVLLDGDGVLHEVLATPLTVRHGSYDPTSRVVAVNVDGHTVSYTVMERTDAWAPDASAAGGAAGDVAAPFPAVVVETPVAPGDTVAAGDTVVVVEAMKMLHSLTAPGGGEIAEVRVTAGDAVESGQVLVTFNTPDSHGESR
jgi:3-methylcrotonyl-CoA carboxylase alpha subunit